MDGELIRLMRYADAAHQNESSTVGAVVVAAGESRRMNGIDKIFYPLGGKPLVWHSLSALNLHPRVDRIVLVTSGRSLKQAKELAAASGFHKAIDVRAGGERRQDSVRLGLERLSDCDAVIAHDGARPFLTADMLDRGIAEAAMTGAAVAAVPVKDTIKSADAAGLVTQTVPRDGLWAVQTPQVFDAALLAEAHRRVRDDVTDDASMVERMGCKVRLFMGSYYNIKVTTPEDITLAQAIIALDRRQRARGGR